MENSCKIDLDLVLSALEGEAGATCISTETWLAHDELVTAVHSDASLCLGYGRILLSIHLHALEEQCLTRKEPALVPKAEPISWTHSSLVDGQSISKTTAVADGETITTLAWLHIPQPSTSFGTQRLVQDAGLDPLDIPTKIIMLGTSTGHVQLHDHKGHLLHRQQLHDQPSLAIQVSQAPATEGITAFPPQTSSTIVVSFWNSVCSISSAAISAVLHHVGSYISAAKHLHDKITLQKSCFCYSKWLMPAGTRERLDSACIPKQRLLWEDTMSLQTQDPCQDAVHRSYISVGIGPAVTLFEAGDTDGTLVVDSEDRVDQADTEVGSMGKFVKGLVGTVLGSRLALETSELLGFSSQGCSCHSADTVNAIADDRTVETLVMSPDEQLAACTDDKGRVLLLDTGNLCFLRSWKGYRDAQCAWLELPTIEPSLQNGELGFWNPQAQCLSHQEKRGARVLAQQGGSPPNAPAMSDSLLAPLERSGSEDGAASQQQHRVYLLIYAPRREVLEVWPARSGHCLRTFKCGSNCALLFPLLGSQTPPFLAKRMERSHGHQMWQDCFLLNGTTGQLFSIAARLQGTTNL